MKKHLLLINGSASEPSSNGTILRYITRYLPDHFTFELFEDLKNLPHFDAEESLHNPPDSIGRFRAKIEAADAVMICTPEYIFSIPSGLKNAMEWCVATTVFTGKPVACITASAHGAKGHEELQLILSTIAAVTEPQFSLLISSVKGKVTAEGEITDETTRNSLHQLIENFTDFIRTSD